LEIIKRLDHGSVLALVTLDRIKVHEDIKEDYLAELKQRIENDKELYRPILVANNDFVVLDGHHRYHACKALGCKRITCILVDYQRDDIIVNAWSPLITDSAEVDAVFDVLENHGFDIEQLDSEEKMHELVDSREAAIGLIKKDSPLEFYCAKHVPKDGAQKKTFSEAMKPIIGDLRERHKLPVLKYLDTADKAKQLILDNEASLLIKVPVISKEKILNRANLEEKYPPKTTKHTLPEIQDYHVTIERLRQVNPAEDTELSEEQRLADEQHTLEHEREEFKPSIEWWYEEA
tara:strand:+ start:21184 stop:22056 length:873 start_codon:yes stop_codon:yes gene_type:complete